VVQALGLATLGADLACGPRSGSGAAVKVEIYTSRFLNFELLSSGVVVPVRVSMHPPLIPLPYELEETAWSLVPEPWMTGEWPWLSPTYWCHLDGQGTQKIGKELEDISERHGGRPLALLDHEDPTKGHRSLRVVFATWWEENTGQEVPELLDDGQILHYSQLHRRTRPKTPKNPREDRRWTDDEMLGWPISHEDFERWARGRHWQFARTQPQNPHEYTHRAWGHEETFLRVVLHLREHGRQEVYGGDLFTYYIGNGFKHWTMGADLMSTILINRKPVGQDEGNEETETRLGGVPQPDLFRARLLGEGRA
jgi:hypothetical protein